MCKKKRPDENIEVKQKTLAELTDGEYLERVEELGVPLYVDYLTAPRFSDVSINGYLSRTDIGILAENAKVDVEEPETVVEAPKGVVYDKKRWFAAFFVTLLSIVLIAAAVIGVLGVELMAEYVAIFNAKSGYISMTEPATATVNYLFEIGFTTVFQEYFNLAYGIEELIPLYVMAGATLIFVICTVIALIKGLAALFSGKKKDGFYKKYRFGVLGFIMLLCALLVAVGGWYIEIGNFNDIIGFVNPLGDAFCFGFALYAMILFPILIMICSGAMFRKKK